MSAVAGDGSCRTTVDSIEAEVEQLVQLATVVLNEHVNDHGLCAVRRSGSVCVGGAGGLAYEQMSDGERAQAIGPTLNKLRSFTTRTGLRLMLGQAVASG